MKSAIVVWSAVAALPLFAQSSPDQVAAILKSACGSCHSGSQAAGKLQLDSLSGVANGGGSGAAVKPGDSQHSPLFLRISAADSSLRMPPTGKPLAAEQIRTIKDWIDGGAAGLIEFSADVKPILQANCYGCHSGAQPKTQLRLDVASGLRKGGVSGPVIVPGKSAESRLIHRIEGTGGEQRMPLKGQALKAEEIARIRAWIDAGARLPEGTETSAVPIEKHWAYKNPVRPTVPDVKHPSLVSNAIDAFLLAKLEQQNLTFSPPASKETLIRRVSLDLIGLPPAPAEVQAFVNDSRPDAYERLVDRLLASPHYGERWARPWLDLARYADTNGYESDHRRTMWKFRDWVIDAFNRDMPFDQFTLEQIAGDMLPNATESQQIASGFHRNTLFNEEGGVDKDESYFEVLVDRVNTTATVWLGSTLGCAQCHTHKYDPFTHKEYYQMMAFFNDTTKKVEANGSTSFKYREPVIDIATPDQKAQRATLQSELDALETKLKTPTPELEAEQARWEGAFLRAKGDWKVLNPTAVSALAGSILQQTTDGTITVAGENPQRETYVVEGSANGKLMTGIRLETLPDASLPRGGPGRDVYGNFILTEFQVEIGNGKQWTPVEFGKIIADDGRVQAKDTHQLWTIDASRDEVRLPRQLVLVCKTPVKLPGRAKLRVRLVQNSDYLGQSIGRFRLSVTSAQDPTVIAKIRPNLRPVLDTVRSQRTSEQAKQVSEYFRTIAPSLDAARDQIKDLKNQIEKLGIVTALVMGEQNPAERPSDNIRIRGAFSSKGDKVYADIPAALGSLPPGAPPNRLGLAEWIASKENPLTARVAVNRIWEAYFGHGIVETSEDFGTQGERPSHPELLDWLAVEFMDHGWSQKQLHKLIVTSTAYRQNSSVSPELLQQDPYNRLISRGPRFRMEAEMIRDVSLAASGLLSDKIGGPSVFPPQPPGVWDMPYNDDKWETSKGKDRYRRGIYTFMRRSAPYPAMVNFDATSRESCTVRRIRTNSPLAALTTLNDEAFFEAAQGLARRVLREGGSTDSARVGYGFQLVTARTPKPEERDKLLTWLDREKKYFSAHQDEGARISGDSKYEAAPWTMLANVLLNLDEALSKE